MPRRGPERTRVDPVVPRATGKVRLPGESSPLDVVIAISTTTITMHHRETELGSWPLRDVHIRRTDPFSFAFVAEGDRLVFVPDDARAFAKLPAVAGSTGSSAAPRAKRLVLRRRTKPSRPDRAGRRRSLSIPKLAIPSRSKSAPVQQSRDGSAAVDDRTLWIKTVDTARENGWFGLDRVPVRTDQRGGSHQHTYEHGAAAKSGPSAHICTQCGKVRLRRTRG